MCRVGVGGLGGVGPVEPGFHCGARSGGCCGRAGSWNAGAARLRVAGHHEAGSIVAERRLAGACHSCHRRRLGAMVCRPPAAPANIRNCRGHRLVIGEVDGCEPRLRRPSRSISATVDAAASAFAAVREGHVDLPRAASSIAISEPSPPLPPTTSAAPARSAKSMPRSSPLTAPACPPRMTPTTASPSPAANWQQNARIASKTLPIPRAPASPPANWQPTTPKTAPTAANSRRPQPAGQPLGCATPSTGSRPVIRLLASRPRGLRSREETCSSRPCSR